MALVKETIIHSRPAQAPTLDLHEIQATVSGSGRLRTSAPVRRRVHGIETFKVLRGGEYFFTPSSSALKWIGNVAETDSSEQEER